MPQGISSRTTTQERVHAPAPEPGAQEDLTRGGESNPDGFVVAIALGLKVTGIKEGKRLAQEWREVAGADPRGELVEQGVECFAMGFLGRAVNGTLEDLANELIRALMALASGIVCHGGLLVRVSGTVPERAHKQITCQGCVSAKHPPAPARCPPGWEGVDTPLSRTTHVLGPALAKVNFLAK
jgi:hypothetical protein